MGARFIGYCSRYSALDTSNGCRPTSFEVDEVSIVGFIPSYRLPMDADYFCPVRNFVEAKVALMFHLLQQIPYQTGRSVPR